MHRQVILLYVYHFWDYKVLHTDSVSHSVLGSPPGRVTSLAGPSRRKSDSYGSYIVFFVHTITELNSMESEEWSSLNSLCPRQGCARLIFFGLTGL